jgi:hypothetical protein
MKRKDLEDTRESTGHEVDDKWAGQPYTSSSCMGFSHNGFLSLSNPEKYIFTLRNVKRVAEV